MCKLNLPLALDILIVLRLTFKPWFMEEPIFTIFGSTLLFQNHVCCKLTLIIYAA